MLSWDCTALPGTETGTAAFDTVTVPLCYEIGRLAIDTWIQWQFSLTVQ